MDARNNEHRPRQNTAQELCQAVENIWHEIWEAIEIIMQKRWRVTPVVACVIDWYRNIVEQLIWQARQQYVDDDENAEIVKLAGKKARQYLDEYSYYSLIADIFEREKIIQKIQAWLKYLSKPEKTLRGRAKQLRLFCTFWINRTQLWYQVQEIILEIETVIEDNHFDWLDISKRKLFEKKWKLYVNKGQKLGISL